MITTRDSQVAAMADLDDQPQKPASSSPNTSSKKKELLSTAFKRTSEWIFSQEIPSDVTIDVGGVSFSLHKFPLVSKCGHIRKLVSDSADSDLSAIELSGMPGGAEAFELAAKFCYGINFEISTENIAALRCAAEYLEMTEDYAAGNLVGRAEAYLSEVALRSLDGATTVLHAAEGFQAAAERANLIGRCVDAIAYIACKESQFCAPGRAGEGDPGSDFGVGGGAEARPMVDWWAEDLTVLRIDMFQRVLVAMMARGFKQYALGPILMLYAQKSLRGLDIFTKGRKRAEPRQEHEKRVVLETVVSLLPRERNAMSVSFLSMLLRAAISLETTVACRLDLERRMGAQLAQAALDDLLIPAADAPFDVDAVRRVVLGFLDHLDEARSEPRRMAFDEGRASPPASEMERVGRLMESYLAEIASDRSLSVAKFIGLAELVPEQSRVTEDGIYRAVDIFLKNLMQEKAKILMESREAIHMAHPALSDMERKKVCSLMDCQKLSRDACAHAAQNDRLPVQTVVQVLYYEQQRLRDAMSSPSADSPSGPDELSVLRRENEDLKTELVKMKTRMKDSDRPSLLGKPLSSPSVDRPPLPRRTSFMGTVSKKLGRLYPFVRSDGGGFGTGFSGKGKTKPSKDRRHSVS